MKFFRFSDFQVLFGLFCTAQDTIFFVLVVDTFAVVTAINDAVAMFGHQQMNDTLVQIAVCLAESVLDRHIFASHSRKHLRWIPLTKISFLPLAVHRL